MKLDGFTVPVHNARAKLQKTSPYWTWRGIFSRISPWMRENLLFPLEFSPLLLSALIWKRFFCLAKPQELKINAIKPETAIFPLIWETRRFTLASLKRLIFAKFETLQHNSCSFSRTFQLVKVRLLKWAKRCLHVFINYATFRALNAIFHCVDSWKYFLHKFCFWAS